MKDRSGLRYLPRGASDDPRRRVLIPLDTPDLARIGALTDILGPVVGGFKVGLELFVSRGPSVVESLVERDFPVFLDLKLHDIPNTVAGAAREAARLGVSMLTVHGAGGREMVAAAVDGAGDGAAAAGVAAPMVVAVTVLTSLGVDALTETGITASPEGQVMTLARLGLAAGAGGLVCSGGELTRLRGEITEPEPVLVVPGIRPSGFAAGDQARVVTPNDAIRKGADWLVVGRPITAAADPRAVVDSMFDEEGR